MPSLTTDAIKIYGKIDNYISTLTWHKIAIFFIVLSWFLPVGIGVDIWGNSLDINKILYILTVTLFAWRVRYKIKFIDKMFIIAVAVQFIGIIFYENPEIQGVYLIFVTLFYYSAYFISRGIFERDAELFDFFVKTIIFMIFLSSVYLLLHINKIYLFDTIRSYSEKIIVHSHQWKRTYSEIDIGSSYTGQFVNPNTYVQFVGIVLALLVPYLLYKKIINKKIAFLTITILVLSGILTHAKIFILLLLFLVILLFFVKYKNRSSVVNFSIYFIILLSLVNYEIIQFIYYNFMALTPYFDGVVQVVGNTEVESAHISRFEIYKAYFEYVHEPLERFFFGHGPRSHLFNSNIIGANDISWLFSSFLRIGLLSFLFYVLIFIKIYKNLSFLKQYDKDFVKFVLVFFLSLLVVGLTHTTYTLNGVYYFIFGSIVSLMEIKVAAIKDKIAWKI